MIQMREGWYDSAQICLNGHVVNISIKATPEHSAKYCKFCGQPTVTTCSECKTEIRGKHFIKGVLSLTPRIALPRYCETCGSPYPWTLAKMKAAEDLAGSIDSLNDDDRSDFKSSVGEVIKDTPQTPVAAARLKKLMKKAGKGAAEGFKNILTDIVSEAAKKMIWP